MLIRLPFKDIFAQSFQEPLPKWNKIVFPELRVLDFNTIFGKFGWISDDKIAFQYFCQNSPKLEEIIITIPVLLDSRFKAICETVGKSIGSLISRPALRKLEIRIEICPDNFLIKPFMDLIRCPSIKPKLECLLLPPLVSLSAVYEFVNMNFNLKSLTLTQIPNERQTLNDATTIQALIQILESENGLDEIRLGGLFYDLKDQLLLRNPYRNRKPYDLNIYRDEFAYTISILNQIKNKIIDADH